MNYILFGKIMDISKKTYDIMLKSLTEMEETLDAFKENIYSFQANCVMIHYLLLSENELNEKNKAK